MITIAHGNFGGLSQWTGVTPAPRMGASNIFSVQPPNQMGLAGRGPELGIFADIGIFLFEGLQALFQILADVLRSTVEFLMEGVDLVFGGLADIVGEIPFIGPLLGKILLFGGSVIEFVLNVPVRFLQGTANILGGIAEFINETWGEDQKEAEINGAKEDILSQAPDAIKDAVKDLLDSSGVTGSNPTPNVSVNPDNPTVANIDRPSETQVNDNMNTAILGPSTGDILTYGIPAAGAAIALALFLK